MKKVRSFLKNPSDRIKIEKWYLLSTYGYLVIFFVLTLLTTILVANRRIMTNQGNYHVQAVGIEYGFAANYPSDQGIENDPAVFKSSSFETTNWTGELGDTGALQPGMSQTTSTFYSGTGSLMYIQTAGTHDGGQLSAYGFTAPDTVYIRWYRRFDTGYDFSCQVKSNGLYAVAPGANSSPGIKPTGLDKYSAKLQYWPDSSGNGYAAIYTYNPDQSDIYGDTIEENIGGRTLIEPGRWYSYELMLKPNTPGMTDGEIKLWIDGVLKGDYPNMHFRDTADLKINEVDVGAYVGGDCVAPKSQYVWDDNLVVASQYIGPMVTGTEVTNWLLILCYRTTSLTLLSILENHKDGCYCPICAITPSIPASQKRVGE